MLIRQALCAFGAALFCLAAHAGTLTTVYTIPGFNDGANPTGPLVKFNGKYYGTTIYGGTSRDLGGTVYTIDLKTKVETVVHNFMDNGAGGEPTVGLIAAAGKLYGVTSYGGRDQGGTVYEVDPTTGATRVIYNLPSDSSSTENLVEYNGLLYGIACGEGHGACIYSVDPAAGTGQIVYSFSSDEHPNGLVVRGNKLFGTENLYDSENDYGDGDIFSFDPRTKIEQTEYDFEGSDGFDPLGTMIAVDGILYGVTSGGGSAGKGTVFSFDATSKQETTLHSFTGGIDGANPSTALLNAGGRLYGTTGSGGSSSLGVVFSLDPASRQEIIIHDFTTGEGNYPGALIEDDNTLYGTLRYGGGGEGGVVYAVDLAGAEASLLHVFAGGEASIPSALIRVGGTLYGTASGGGGEGLGSIFKIDPVTGAGETKYSFSGPDGARPSGGLADVNGTIYGTTSSGGSSNAGTIFSFDPNTRKLATLYAFDGKTEGNPSCGLIVYGNLLYGTAPPVGSSYYATLFNIDPATLQESAVNLIQTSCLTLGGNLFYGTAYGGGAQYGAIYSVDPANGVETTVHDFQGGLDGAYPEGSLLFSGGILFGTTDSTPPQVFKFDLTTDLNTILHTFNEGFVSLVTPLIAHGNKIFGSIQFAEKAHYGAVVRINPVVGGAALTRFTGQQGGGPSSALLHTNVGFYGTTKSTDVTNAGTVFLYKP